MPSDLIERIAAAFAHRAKPDAVVDAEAPDNEEALVFRGRSWAGTTADEWHAHPDAFTRFGVAAFCYYLPGALRVAVMQPQRWVAGVDTLLAVFDSPSLSYWNDWQRERYTALMAAEREVFEEAVVSLSAYNAYDAVRLGNVLTTLGLIAARGGAT